MKFYEKKTDLAALLPDMLSGTAELAAICAAEGVEIDKGNLLIAQTADNLCIASAAAEGLTRWEKILGGSMPIASTIQARRDALIAKLMTKPPINLYVLNSIIEAYLGLEVELSVSGYIVRVRYRGETKIADLAPLYATAYEAIPANLILDIAYKFLTWNELDSLGLFFDGLDAKGLSWREFEKGEWING